MLPILSFHLSRCQRQISDCSNVSLEILVFNYDDVVDDDDYNKDDMYEVDYSLNNYRTVHRSCGSTVDCDEINLNAGNGNGKKVSCSHNPCKLRVYLIFTNLFIIARCSYIGTF